MANKKDKIIIGLVGEIASGKDSIADYLKNKYQSQTVSFSQPLRDILDRLYLPQTRVNMAGLGVSLRELFGQELLANAIGKEAKAVKSPVVCLPNVRLKSDIVNLRKIKGFVLIHVDTDAKIRYERIVKRSQNADDKNKTWKQFLKDSKLSTEIEIRKIAKEAKFKIDNNGDYKKLYKQIDEMMKEII